MMKKPFMCFQWMRETKVEQNYVTFVGVLMIRNASRTRED